MGLAYNTYLNSSRIYGCKGCKTHLANHDDIMYGHVCSKPDDTACRSWRKACKERDSR